MPVQKRKAVDDTPEKRPTRRVSGRAKKIQVKYEESFSDVDDKESDGDFDDDIEASVDEEDGAEPDDLDASEGSTKVTGKGRRRADSDGEKNMVIPQERNDGGVPYEDERIHTNTMDFLRDLKKNNKREWLKCSYTFIFTIKSILKIF